MNNFSNKVILIIITIFTLCACAENTNTTKSIRLAHGLDVLHPVHQSLVFMDETLDTLSGGTLTLDIYPSGQLGSEREIIELLQIGSMGMTKVSANTLSSFVPEMEVFSLPYLFNDNEHYWRTLESDIGTELLSHGTNYRVKGLGYFDAGSRSFYTSGKKVTSPSDLNGLKIRVMNSDSAVDMVNTIGGSATPVSWGELYTSLQQGIVDGAENNPPTFYYSKHYEVSEYYLLDEHTSIPDVIIIGTHMWNSLNTQEQAWLSEAMKKATAYQRKLWAESTQMSLQKVKDAGVKVIQADKTLFQQSVIPLYDELKGTDMEQMVNDIRQLGNS